MTRIGRYVKFTARTGEGDALAAELQQAADGAAQAEGCELYVINRVGGEPETVWVTEIWASQEACDAALSGEETKAQIARVLPLLDGTPERIDVEPVGGLGVPDGAG